MVGLSLKKRVGILGTPLAEVFSVVISPRAEDSKLYGEIWVDDAEGTLYIYNLGSDDAETIRSNDRLLLSNTDRAILPRRRHLAVYFNVKDKMNGDDDFISSSFIWDEATDGYDKLLVKDVEGKLGSATVYYTVHSCAVEANIGAKFVMCEETMKSHPNVVGKLVAHYKKLYDDDDDDDEDEDDSEDHCQCTLYEGTLLDVEDGDIVILDRSVVALPSYTSLVIQAYFENEEDGQVLWDGEVEFSTNSVHSNTIHQEIQGARGAIKVSVRAVDYAGFPFKFVKCFKASLLQIGAFPECC